MSRYSKEQKTKETCEKIRRFVICEISFQEIWGKNCWILLQKQDYILKKITQKIVKPKPVSNVNRKIFEKIVIPLEYWMALC